MDTYVDLDVAFGLDPARFDAATGSCVFTTARHQIFRTSAPAFPGAEVEFVSYGTVTFELDGAYPNRAESIESRTIIPRRASTRPSQ